jgi:hypothetical protein
MAKKHEGSTKTPHKDSKPAMPGGTHGEHPETMSQMRPGPINDPAQHPVNNIPAPQDSRWAEQLDPSQVSGAY